MISHVHVVAPTQTPQSAVEGHSCKRSMCLLSIRTSGVMTHAAAQTIQGNAGYQSLLPSFISVLKIIHEKVFCLCKVGRKSWGFLGGIMPWQILPRANLKTAFSHRAIHFSASTYLRSQQWVCQHLALEVSVVLLFSRSQQGCRETGAGHAMGTSRARGWCSLSPGFLDAERLSPLLTEGMSQGFFSSCGISSHQRVLVPCVCRWHGAFQPLDHFHHQKSSSSPHLPSVVSGSDPTLSFLGKFRPQITLCSMDAHQHNESGGVERLLGGETRGDWRETTGSTTTSHLLPLTRRHPTLLGAPWVTETPAVHVPAPPFPSRGHDIEPAPPAAIHSGGRQEGDFWHLKSKQMVNSCIGFCGQNLKAQMHLSQTPFQVFLLQAFVFFLLLWHQQTPSGNTGIVLANNTAPAFSRPKAWHWREQLCLPLVSLERQNLLWQCSSALVGRKHLRHSSKLSSFNLFPLCLFLISKKG